VRPGVALARCQLTRFDLFEAVGRFAGCQCECNMQSYTMHCPGAMHSMLGVCLAYASF
jgi:hypothetical protein